MASLLETVSSVPPANWCRAFFLLATTGVLAVQATPEPARRLLNDYGARGSTAARRGGQRRADDASYALVRQVTAAGQVPHSWFGHFYAAYLAASVFWAYQLQGGVVLTSMAEAQARKGGPSMSFSQVTVVGLMMECQAARRLYECHAVMARSSSTMWIVHWLLAICFYLTMGVAVWIEGSVSLLHGPRVLDVPSLFTGRTIAALGVFVAASVQQNKCHRYLASLKKYSLPSDGMFRYLVCPHYTCECLIYLSLAFAAAPRGHLFNRTLLCAALFVGVNLGATAVGTKEWYAQRFGAGKVAGKWNMIPFFF